MKPTMLCGKCRAPLVLSDKFCSSCGEPIDWQAETAAAHKPQATIYCASCGAENDSANDVCVSCGVTLGTRKGERPKAQEKVEQQQRRKKSPDQPVVPTWKMMAGFVAFLAVGVLALELLTAKKIEQFPHTHEEETNAANMQALQQVEEMEKRLAANPNDQALLLQLANQLHDARFFDKAIQRYNEYLQKNPKDADARVDLGISYYETDRAEEAKLHMLKALEVHPKHVLGHFNLGIVNLRIAQTAMNVGDSQKANEAMHEANEWFKKTVALDPNGSAGQRAQRFLAEHSNQQNLPTN